MIDRFTGPAADTALLIVELAVLFFVVTVAVELFQARFGADRLRTWMGGPPLSAALKGIALGFITPFCTFTAVPMLIGMRQAKVPPAGYVAFIIAAPVLDPVLFGALVIITGLQTAMIYAAIAFVAAVGLALMADRIKIERFLTPIDNLIAGADEAPPTCGSENETDDNRTWRGLGAELPPAARRAQGLLTGMAPILLAGIVLSLIIEAAVPPEITERLTAANPSLAVPVAAALGTPLYVSTAMFVPIADALQAAGVGIGAIVALTIAGAGANLPEFVILSKLANRPVIGSFFLYVFGVAVAGGALTQALVG